MSLLQQWMTIGLTVGAVVGGIAGLVLGLENNPATAWFAVFEVGLPAALVGAVLGALAALILTASRRINRGGAPPA